MVPGAFDWRLDGIGQLLHAERDGAVGAREVGFTESLAQEGEDASAVSFYMLLAVALALVAALPVALVCPIAGGSGIAEMKVYLNGIHVPGLLRVTTFACKAFSMCLSIPSGMVLGTAGPYVHLGESWGGLVPGFKPVQVQAEQRTRGLQSKFAHRSFVTMGIAAGVATVFTAPIGGVLIAFEDCGSFYLGSTKMFWQCFLATCSGVLSASSCASRSSTGTSASSVPPSTRGEPLLRFAREAGEDGKPYPLKKCC